MVKSKEIGTEPAAAKQLLRTKGEKYVIEVTEDYERLVPFFVANDLEFPDEDEEYEVPTDLVCCWKVTEGIEPEPAEDSTEYIAGACCVAPYC